MKEFISFVAKALVEAKDDVVVADGGVDDDGRQVIELHVAADDRGKVIGKKGRMAHSLRTLLTAASKPPARTTLEIID